jgi:hypothetical protein
MVREVDAGLPAWLGSVGGEAFPIQAGNSAVVSGGFRSHSRRTHPPYGWPIVGRVCPAEKKRGW